MTLELAIRDAVTKLDPNFGYADRWDAAAERYDGLIWAKAPPEPLPPTAVLVRAEVALEHLRRSHPAPAPGEPATPGPGPGGPSGGEPGAPAPGTPGTPPAPAQPRRFYGSVEIDMVRTVKSFDAILNAVVMELQRTPGAKVKLTLEIEAEAKDGFPDSEISVVRDNARQLKFKPESTGFGD